MNAKQSFLKEKREMGEENKVFLLRAWSSPFAKIVELALTLKGVAFEYVEEDLRNKSPQLLNYNPVHKKVPVLVHKGKPIVESLIIAEYIDETWKNSPQLLPEDPYKRAKVRFWCCFVQQQIFGSISTVLKTEGEAQEKAINEVSEKLQLLEEGLKEFYPDGSSAMGSETVGLLDLVCCSMLGLADVQEEFLGVKILDSEKTPLICSLITAIRKLPMVKELTPPHDKLVALLKFIRRNALKSTPA